MNLPYSVLLALVLFVAAVFLPAAFVIAFSMRLRRWMAVWRRWIFGETFRVYAGSVLLAEVRTRQRHVTLEVSPGYVVDSQGRPIRYHVESPPIATAEVAVVFMVHPPKPPFPDGPFR